MIRRMFTLMIFTSTVMLAAFGQHIFGREDLIRIAAQVKEHGPHQVEIALNKTDHALSQLVTEAGTEITDPACMYQDLAWVISINTASL